MEKTKIIDIPEGCKQIQVTDTEIKFLHEKENEIKHKKDEWIINDSISGIKRLFFPPLLEIILSDAEFQLLCDKIIQNYKDKYNIDNIVEQINKADSGLKKQKINVIHEITGNKTIAFIRNSDVKFMTIPKDEYDLIYDWIIQDYKNKIQ